MDEDKLFDMLEKDYYDDVIREHDAAIRDDARKWKVDWDMHDCMFQEYKTDPEDVFEAVKDVRETLTELQLRERHDDLKQAWEEYYNLLEKYRFWNELTK